MQESERRRRFDGVPRMSPEEVAGRAFSTARRGYSEQEVRSFLRRLSEELAGARDRERELISTLEELEGRLRSPRPLDEKELLDAFGEETARLLRSAKEAADDMRAKAEARVARMLEEAQAEARRLRDDTQAEARRLREEAEQLHALRTDEAAAAAATLTEEAEARIAASHAEAERRNEEQREQAVQDAQSLVEEARNQGREMLEEAKAVRERVLSDLVRRRDLLQTQLDELRKGRDALLDAYRVVKRSFLDATEALANAEARAAARTAEVEPSEPVEVAGAAGVAGAVDLAAAEAEQASREAGGAGEAGTEGEALTAVAGDTDEERRGPALADVEGLFARLRAGASDDVAEAPDTPPGAEAAAPRKAAAGGTDDTTPVTGAEAADAADAADTERAVPQGGGTAGPAALDRWRDERAAALSPLVTTLLKSVKRAAQDEQNALLDAVRRTRGRPAAADVLPDHDTHLATWAELMRPDLAQAYRAGRAAAGAGPGGDPGDGAVSGGVVAEVSAGVLLPLRERLVLAVDDAADLGADTTALIAERVGARYREWRTESLENLIEEALTVAWARGVYDTAPEGAVLQWVPAEEGRCADCDDNALEPTVKGAAFPTGQLHPPAHPGCRCLLIPSEVLAGLTPAAG